MTKNSVKPRRGDVIIHSTTYSTLGPSHWPGIVFSVEPLVIFPAIGSLGARMFPKKDETVTIVPQGIITRTFNIIASRIRMALSK